MEGPKSVEEVRDQVAGRLAVPFQPAPVSSPPALTGATSGKRVGTDEIVLIYPDQKFALRVRELTD